MIKKKSQRIPISFKKYASQKWQKMEISRAEISQIQIQLT